MTPEDAIESWDPDRSRPYDYIIRIDHRGWFLEHKNITLPELAQLLPLYCAGDPCD